MQKVKIAVIGVNEQGRLNVPEGSAVSGFYQVGALPKPEGLVDRLVRTGKEKILMGRNFLIVRIDEDGTGSIISTKREKIYGEGICLSHSMDRELLTAEGEWNITQWCPGVSVCTINGSQALGWSSDFSEHNGVVAIYCNGEAHIMPMTQSIRANGDSNFIVDKFKAFLGLDVNFSQFGITSYELRRAE